jgi:hypothetical protein
MRIESLNMLLDTVGKDFLAEEYGKVIENIQKTTISSALKNTDLSGTPTAGTVEAKRFVNSQSQPYGTARAAHRASAVKARPVTVPIDKDREIVEELEEKDIQMYGVEGTIQRRILNHQLSLTREIERAFFAEAATAATAVAPGSSVINVIAEAAIQQVEAVKNDFVDGVPRDLISLVLDTATYGLLRDDLDRGANNANVDTAAAEFGTWHGVRVYSSVYLPTGVRVVGMAHGAVAQPIRANVTTPRQLELSDAYAFGIFFYYGTKAVAPDLICKLPAA